MDGEPNQLAPAVVHEGGGRTAGSQQDALGGWQREGQRAGADGGLPHILVAGRRVEPGIGRARAEHGQRLLGDEARCLELADV